MPPTTTINVVQGDSGYPLQFTLQSYDGTPINLTSPVVTIKGQLFGGDAVKFTGTLSSSDPTNGVCEYTVQPTDFDAEGRYHIEITITYGNGEILSYVNIVVVAAPKLPSA